MSDYSSSPTVSRGWPFADCAVHIQRRGNGEPDIHLIEDTCSQFGRILKTYIWDSKKSNMPQIFVLFNSPDAVQNTLNSTRDHSVRLWKSGYHLLRMCESTSEKLKEFLEKDGYTPQHSLFDKIPLKWKVKPYHSKPWTGKQKSHHETPVGPRYKPYSLDSRHGTSPSGQASQPSTPHVKFPPKKETMSPPSSSMSPLTWTKQESPSPSMPPAAVPAQTLSSGGRPRSDLPHVAQLPNPEFLEPSVAVSAPELASAAAKPTTDINILNQRLTKNITELVSTTIDAASQIHELKMDNEKLREQLESSQEVADLLRDTVKHIEGREQAVIALLNKSESDQNALKELNVKVVQGIQGLRQRYGEVGVAKAKAEAECEAMAKRVGFLETQLASTHAQLASTQTQLANARGQLVSRLQPSKLPTVEASAQTESLRAGTEDASSVDQEDLCATPPVALEYMHHADPGKANLEHLPELMGAFKDIDELLRTAFDGL
ncbi:hypothetical protein BDV93DRAFT_518746 [Ceratobasidium sp. AG-I]|nr:hypothetical protein BDV93DRAFT_518746 [Ceratobasidium sp. AG-I]